MSNNDKLGNEILNVAKKTLNTYLDVVEKNKELIVISYAAYFLSRSKRRSRKIESSSDK